MARGATTSEGSGGENIQHFSTIRIRANGSGNLKLMVMSLDYEAPSPTLPLGYGRNKVLTPLVLEPKTRIQPNRLVNFVEQRASFEITTTEIDEWVRINRIIVYMKEIYSSHPGA